MSLNGDAVALNLPFPQGWKVVNFTEMTGLKIAGLPKY